MGSLEKEQAKSGLHMLIYVDTNSQIIVAKQTKNCLSFNLPEAKQSSQCELLAFKGLIKGNDN